MKTRHRLFRWAALLVLTAGPVGGLVAQDTESLPPVAATDSEPATPASPSDEDRRIFRAADINEDGVLSGAELMPFRRYDMDGDGRVTLEEFLGAREAARQAAALALQRLPPVPSITAAPHGTTTAPPLDAELRPGPGMMVGRVMTWDGRPIPRFTIEYAAYVLDEEGRLVLDGSTPPNAVGQIEGRDGYYELRLPEGSYGVVSSVSLPLLDGQQTFRFWAENESLSALDFLEIEKGNPGVVKNFVWNLRGPAGVATFVASPHYGASLAVANEVELIDNQPTRLLAQSQPASARIVVTLTPRSPLIDGTPGRVLTRTLTVGDLGGPRAVLRDIPFAVYEISARLISREGMETPLRVALEPPTARADRANRRLSGAAHVVVDFAALGAFGGDGPPSARLFIAE